MRAPVPCVLVCLFSWVLAALALVLGSIVIISVNTVRVQIADIHKYR